MSLFDLLNFNARRWQPCAPCPIERAEGSGIQLGSTFYIFGGFHTIDQVVSDAHVLDLATARWVDRFAMPPEMGHTHIGLASEAGRFIYSVAGQIGPQCSPATAACMALDTQSKQWHRLPPLPEARYAPVVQFWNDRLHALGGSTPDRITPALDHWSIAVHQGKALENTWRPEITAPKGGPHGTSRIINGEFYIFGGELGDVKAVAGDAGFKCDWNTPMEIVYGNSYKLAHPNASWERLADMPFPSTHMESSIFNVGPAVVMAGGNRSRDRLSDLIQIFDIQKNAWRPGGKLPYAMKTTTAYHDGWLYLITGQRGKNMFNADPDKVLSTVWRTKFLI